VVSENTSEETTKKNKIHKEKTKWERKGALIAGVVIWKLWEVLSDWNPVFVD